MCTAFTATGHTIVYFDITKCVRQWAVSSFWSCFRRYGVYVRIDNSLLHVKYSCKNITNECCHASEENLYMRIENSLLDAKYSYQNIIC